MRTEAVAIDRAARTVTACNLATGSEEQIRYDSLVLAPGAAFAHRPRTAVILGGGFIGLEVAEHLVARGLDVTVVELADQVLAPLDPEMAQPVAERLAAMGVSLRTGVSAARIDNLSVELSTGEALDAGLAIGVRGGIVVDVSQRTSDPHIFAVDPHT